MWFRWRRWVKLTLLFQASDENWVSWSHFAVYKGKELQCFFLQNSELTFSQMHCTISVKLQRILSPAEVSKGSNFNETFPQLLTKSSFSSMLNWTAVFMCLKLSSVPSIFFFFGKFGFTIKRENETDVYTHIYRYRIRSYVFSQQNLIIKGFLHNLLFTI